MNVIVACYVPHGRRFSIASCLICVYSSLIIGIATIPKTSPIIAISLFIVAILGETILILSSEFAFAPPVHLHLMSERHGGASQSASGCPPSQFLCLHQVLSLFPLESPSYSSPCARPNLTPIF